MARLITPLGTFELVKKPVFAELRAVSAYFGKKAEDLDVIEQMMGELYISAKRAQPGVEWWIELEKISPEDIERQEDAPEPETEYVPDPLGDAIPTGVSG